MGSLAVLSWLPTEKNAHPSKGRRSEQEVKPVQQTEPDFWKELNSRACWGESSQQGSETSFLQVKRAVTVAFMPQCSSELNQGPVLAEEVIINTRQQPPTPVRDGQHPYMLL